MLCWAVQRYYTAATLPFYHGTITVWFTVLFGTAIPQVPLFYRTVAAQDNKISNAVCSILMVAYRFVLLRYATKVILGVHYPRTRHKRHPQSVLYSSTLVVLSSWIYSLTYLLTIRRKLHHVTTEYHGIFSRYVPRRKIVGIAQH